MSNDFIKSFINISQNLLNQLNNVELESLSRFKFDIINENENETEREFKFRQDFKVKLTEELNDFIKTNAEINILDVTNSNTFPNININNANIYIENLIQLLPPQIRKNNLVKLLLKDVNLAISVIADTVLKEGFHLPNKTVIQFSKDIGGVINFQIQMTNENVYYILSFPSSDWSNSSTLSLHVSLLQSTCGWFWNLFDDDKSCNSSDIIYDGGISINIGPFFLNTYISNDLNLIVNIKYYQENTKLLLELNTMMDIDNIDSNNLPHIKCIISKKIQDLFILQLVLDYVKKDGKNKLSTYFNTNVSNTDIDLLDIMESYNKKNDVIIIPSEWDQEMNKRNFSKRGGEDGEDFTLSQSVDVSEDEKDDLIVSQTVPIAVESGSQWSMKTEAERSKRNPSMRRRSGVTEELAEVVAQTAAEEVAEKRQIKLIFNPKKNKWGSITKQIPEVIALNAIEEVAEEVERKISLSFNPKKNKWGSITRQIPEVIAEEVAEEVEREISLSFNPKKNKWGSITRQIPEVIAEEVAEELPKISLIFNQNKNKWRSIIGDKLVREAKLEQVTSQVRNLTDENLESEIAAANKEIAEELPKISQTQLPTDPNLDTDFSRIETQEEIATEKKLNTTNMKTSLKFDNPSSDMPQIPDNSIKMKKRNYKERETSKLKKAKEVALKKIPKDKKNKYVDRIQKATSIKEVSKIKEEIAMEKKLNIETRNIRENTTSMKTSLKFEDPSSLDKSIGISSSQTSESIVDRKMFDIRKNDSNMRMKKRDSHSKLDKIKMKALGKIPKKQKYVDRIQKATSIKEVSKIKQEIMTELK